MVSNSHLITVDDKFDAVTENENYHNDNEGGGRSYVPPLLLSQAPFQSRDLLQSAPNESVKDEQNHERNQQHDDKVGDEIVAQVVADRMNFRVLDVQLALVHEEIVQRVVARVVDFGHESLPTPDRPELEKSRHREADAEQEDEEANENRRKFLTR